MTASPTSAHWRDRVAFAPPDQPAPNAPRPATRRAAPCPVCGKPSTEKYRTFCSARCADVDMGRWLSGNYRVETDIAIDEEPGAA